MPLRRVNKQTAELHVYSCSHQNSISQCTNCRVAASIHFFAEGWTMGVGGAERVALATVRPPQFPCSLGCGAMPPENVRNFTRKSVHFGAFLASFVNFCFVGDDWDERILWPSICRSPPHPHGPLLSGFRGKRRYVTNIQCRSEPGLGHTQKIHNNWKTFYCTDYYQSHDVEYFQFVIVRCRTINSMTAYIHCVPKKGSHQTFGNNFVKS